MTKPLRRVCYTLLVSAVGLGVFMSMSEFPDESPSRAKMWSLDDQQVARGAPEISPDRHATLPVEELAPGLFRIESSAGSSVLALRGDTHSLLVDAGTLDGAPDLQSTLDSLRLGPVSHVIVTHYHDDHIAGAAWFKARGALVVAHERTVVEASRDTVISDWNDWHRTPAAPAAMPDSSFVTELLIRLGPNLVRVLHVPRAHTGGDAIVSFENLGVVHTGDIYEVGAYPFIDHWAGGTVNGMIEAVDSLVAQFPAETTYVPGHGPVGGRAQLRDYRNMLADVCQKLLVRIESGDDVNAAIQTQPTSRYDDTMWGAPRHGRQLAALMFWSLESNGPNAVCSG